MPEQKILEFAEYALVTVLAAALAALFMAYSTEDIEKRMSAAESRIDLAEQRIEETEKRLNVYKKQP